MILIMLLIMSFVVAEIPSECNRFKSCGKCIGNPNKCVWCSAENHKGPRCVSEIFSNLTKHYCNETVYNPQMLKLELEAKEFTEVQLKPQKVKYKARPGSEIDVEIQYKPKTDYALDIYYLMDNSYTMRFQKENLIKRAKDILNELKFYSNNVRFGAGTLVEKNHLPYASPINDFHNAYAFINHLNLTDMSNGTKQFEEAVNSTVFRGNYDIPEAIFDGLMQAMVCDIGWRPKSKRIIILSTDAPYHNAGDGQVVGAWKPNDMKCHLDKNGEYDKALLYDYPSVSQIRKVSHEKMIKIIFAASKSVEDVYNALSNVIGSRYFELSETTNLVQKIAEEYKSVLQELTLSIQSISAAGHVELDLPCMTEKCDVPYKSSVAKTATIKVKSCPPDGKPVSIQVRPTNAEDVLDIEIEVDCVCDCERGGSGVPNSPKCNSTGTYQCGVCKCAHGRYGDSCQCVGTSTIELDEEKCRASNNTNLCNGRGECRCGKCVGCMSGYSGEFCQYGQDCKFYGDKICGGNGVCLNSKCECAKGWTKDDCSCSIDVTPCYGPHTQMCSGKGECHCGKCECNTQYIGMFCSSCEDLEDYVVCNYNNKKSVCDEEDIFKQLAGYNISNIKKDEAEKKADDDKVTRCDKKLPDGSLIAFYLDEREPALIYIQIEKELPPKPEIWIPVAIAIGVILLVGLLTVVFWKIIVDKLDEKEYKKFYEESQKAGFNVSNPLYQPPATNINNPAYHGHIDN